MSTYASDITDTAALVLASYASSSLSLDAVYGVCAVSAASAASAADTAAAASAATPCNHPQELIITSIDMKP